LQDDHKYGISDSDLRPEHGNKVTATVTGNETGGNDNGSGDEILLRAIRHQTDVEWTEERLDKENNPLPLAIKVDS
jgi:hypothetical protein